MTHDDDAPARDEHVNEITAAAHEAKRCREGADRTSETAKHREWPLAKLGIAAGVGSAALAAALLYVNRDRR